MESKAILKRCICPCNKPFIDRTQGAIQVYFNKDVCRNSYLKDKYKPGNPTVYRQRQSKPKDAPFRKTVCVGRGISGEPGTGPLCPNFSKCSDSVFTGELWEHEKTGLDCYTKPEPIINHYKSVMAVRT